jgi:hypothetical protein
MNNRRLNDKVIHFGGVIAMARQQGDTEQLEKPYSSRGENPRSKVDAITEKREKR